MAGRGEDVDGRKDDFVGKYEDVGTTTEKSACGLWTEATRTKKLDWLVEIVCLSAQYGMSLKGVSSKIGVGLLRWVKDAADEVGESKN